MEFKCTVWKLILFLIWLPCLVLSVSWSNWDDMAFCNPVQIVYPASEEEIVSIVNQARMNNQTLKVYGAGHSYCPNMITNGILMNLDNMSSVISVNISDLTMVVQAGIRLYDLFPAMEQHGLAIPNSGTIQTQSIAGAISTATHGSGIATSSLSEQVIAMRMVLANGSIAIFSSSSPDDILHAATTSVGALGIITQVTIQCVPSYKLILGDRLWVDAESVMDDIDSWVNKYDRPTFSWPVWDTHLSIYPLTLCSSGSGCVPWYQAFSSREFSFKTYEMEMQVDMKAAPLIFHEFQAFANTQSHTPDITWNLSFRFVKKEKSWISPFYGRNTTSIVLFLECKKSNVNVPCNTDAVVNVMTTFGSALEEISYKYGGRPHWGKVNNANSTYLASCYEKFNDFVQLRRQLDPTGMFLNDYLKQRML